MPEDPNVCAACGEPLSTSSVDPLYYSGPARIGSGREKVRLCRLHWTRRCRDVDSLIRKRNTMLDEAAKLEREAKKAAMVSTKGRFALIFEDLEDTE